MAEQTRAVRPIRVSGDLAEMLGWIVKIDGGVIADIVDPLLRPAIQARYERIRPAVEAFQAAKLAFAAPELGNPVG